MTCTDGVIGTRKVRANRPKIARAARQLVIVAYESGLVGRAR